MFFYKHSPPLPPCLPWTVINSAISVPMNRQNFVLDIRNITSWVNSPDICSTQISQKHQHFPSKAAVARYTPQSAVHISPGGAALPTAACSTRFEPRARAVAAWREGQWHVVKIKLKLNWKSAVGCRVARWSLAAWCQQVYAAGNGLLMWGWKRGNFSDWPSFT